MTWTPPSLQTARLDLVALSGEKPQGFQNRKNTLYELSGLPSNWTIFFKGSDEGIGSIGFIRWERDLALGELGFILKHSERKKGYMSEACSAVIDFGSRFMSLKTIEGRSMSKNVASMGLLKKMGMLKTGEVRVRLSQKGACVDLDVYQMKISKSRSSFGR